MGDRMLRTNEKVRFRLGFVVPKHSIFSYGATVLKAVKDRKEDPDWMAVASHQSRGMVAWGRLKVRGGDLPDGLRLGYRIMRRLGRLRRFTDAWAVVPPKGPLAVQISKASGLDRTITLEQELSTNLDENTEKWRKFFDNFVEVNDDYAVMMFDPELLRLAIAHLSSLVQVWFPLEQGQPMVITAHNGGAAIMPLVDLKSWPRKKNGKLPLFSYPSWYSHDM